ncbi:Gfo/Idh/MocA family protein [Streptomyces sp. NPDC056831]|uniref:Gfo/Idh/MocA family protein n=1 Tax=Streptomyces sp. NPDC056831 TaxID=3345954 RepID=UPI0036B600BF
MLLCSGGRVVVIGAGRWGRTRISALTRFADIAAVATVERESAGARWVRETLPGVVHHHGPYGVQELLNTPDIAACFICTPINTHTELTTLALEKGIDVFLEKPIGTTSQGSWQLCHMAEALGNILFVGNTHAFSPGLDWLLSRAAVDPIVEARLAWGKFGTFNEPVLWNLMVHEVAIIQSLFCAPPTSVHVIRGNPADPTCDRSLSMLTFPEGAASIDIDRRAVEPYKVVEVRTRSGAKLQWSGRHVWETATDGKKLVHYSEEQSIDREMEAFFRCLERSDAPPLESPGSAQFSAQLIDILMMIADQCGTELPRGREL